MDARVADWLSSVLASPWTWVRSLSFGITSELDLLQVDGELLVLRRYVDQNLIGRHPDPITDEVGVLTAARTVLGDLVPRPVASDHAGTVAGQPLLLMTYLPGAPLIHDLDPVRLVGPLVRLHAVDGAGLPPFRHWLDRERMRIPSWTSAADAWGRVVELASSPAPPSRNAFLHRDYHPGNLLWEGGTLTGIVDWAVGCRGPVAADVAHTRCNLMLTDGPGAPERFLREYERADPSYEHHPWWDAAELLTWDDEFSGVMAFNAFGAELTLELLRSRADSFAEAVARHSATTDESGSSR